MPARAAADKSITTVEGIGAEKLHPVQKAFMVHDALQWGFCTSGILISLTELLSDNPVPTEHEVREILTGHLCRCTGYAGPVRAALATAEHLKNIKGAA
jgi:xanthine dehydrogenase YagR molybdenum-binding subunit